jgi:hypothetical protein
MDCFLVKGGRVSPWTMERSFVHEGQVWGIGPFIEGKSLSTIIDSGSQNPERLIEALASAFSLLKTSTVSRIMTSAVLVSEDSMLFLPDEFIGRIEKTAGEHIRINSFTGFNHPDLSGEGNLSFVLGALSYRLFAGELPFSGTTGRRYGRRYARSAYENSFTLSLRYSPRFPPSSWPLSASREKPPPFPTGGKPRPAGGSKG